MQYEEKLKNGIRRTNKCTPLSTGGLKTQVMRQIRELFYPLIILLTPWIIRS